MRNKSKLGEVNHFGNKKEQKMARDSSSNRKNDQRMPVEKPSFKHDDTRKQSKNRTSTGKMVR